MLIMTIFGPQKGSLSLLIGCKEVLDGGLKCSFIS